MSPAAGAHRAETHQSPSILTRVLQSPLSLGLAILSLLRPYAPTLIPLVVCSLFIPLVLLISSFAGWYVWSSLCVSWEAPLYFQYGDGIAPYAYVQLPPLTAQQRYHISVNLIVPNSETNIALGNFMATLTLATPTNQTLAQVRRPALVLPAKPGLLFSKAITSQINIPMLESFMTTKSTLAAAVEIGRRDGWTTLGSGQGREVSVLSASLRGLAVPHGIRGLAIRSPLLASLVAAGIFCLILFLTLGTCVLPLILPNIPPGEFEDSKDIAKAEKMDPPMTQSAEYPAQDRERRRRRSRSNRSSRESPTRVKVEAPVETIPSTSQDPNRGLRRRSSKPVISPSQDTSIS